MTEPEFWDWWSDYIAAFPNADAAMGRIQDENNPGGKRTLKMWLEAFADVNLADAQEVTKMMVRGEIDAIEHFKIGTTAAVVRKHANELAHSRSRAAAEPDWKQVEERTERMAKAKAGTGFTGSMKDDLATLARMKKAKVSRVEIEKFLRSQYPEDRTDRRERYGCLRCKSTGMVSVWSERAMRAVMDGTIENRANRTTCAIPCNCPMGYSKIPLDPTRPTAFRRRFDELLDVPCEDPDSLDAVNDLERFVEERKNARPSNYEAGFDNYADGL